MAEFIVMAKVAHHNTRSLIRPSLNSALNFVLKRIVPTQNCRKSFDWDTIDALGEADLIEQGNCRNKSVYLTDKGLARAQDLLDQFGMEDWYPIAT